MGFLYQAGPNGLLTFAFVSVLLGGAASMAAGRALAASWRPLSHCLLYAMPIAGTAGFLHYALFEESVIPLYALAAAFIGMSQSPLAGMLDILHALRGFFILCVIQAGFAILGYRLTRERQMNSQYGFSRGQRKI